MREPLVSACIGTYNREATIRECLDSVLAQTYPNLEVVVVDNASTDRTVEILESYGGRVRVIKRQVNSGMCSTTRNQAVKAATGRKGKALFMPLRLALTGQPHGPDMAALLPLIGRDEALKRLGA